MTQLNKQKACDLVRDAVNYADVRLGRYDADKILIKISASLGLTPDEMYEKMASQYDKDYKGVRKLDMDDPWFKGS